MFNTLDVVTELRDHLAVTPPLLEKFNYLVETWDIEGEDAWEDDDFDDDFGGVMNEDEAWRLVMEKTDDQVRAYYPTDPEELEDVFGTANPSIEEIREELVQDFVMGWETPGVTERR